MAAGKGISEGSTSDAKYAFYNECNRQVALLCNHKKAESKNLPEQLEKMQEKIDDKKLELKAVTQQLKRLQGGDKEKPAPSKKKPSDKESTTATSTVSGGLNTLPKTVDACKTKIKKIKE